MNEKETGPLRWMHREGPVACWRVNGAGEHAEPDHRHRWGTGSEPVPAFATLPPIAVGHEVDMHVGGEGRGRTGRYAQSPIARPPVPLVQCDRLRIERA